MALRRRQFAGLAALLPLSALAQGTAFHRMGVLGPQLREDPPDRPWRVSDENGAMRIENQSVVREVGSFFLERDRVARPGVPISLSVSVTMERAAKEGDGLHGAGLVYARREAPGGVRYWALLLQSNGSVLLIDHQPRTFTRIGTAQPRGGGSVQLTVLEGAGRATFGADGAEVATLAADGIGEGRVGVCMFGQGRVLFDGFRLAPA